MGLSIRELKAHLSAHGVDFSTCREKSELEDLWSSVQCAKQVTESAGDSIGAVSCLSDGGFALHKADGRHCWVEFVDENDALCLWADGSDGILDVHSLEPVETGGLPGPQIFKGSFEEARAEAFRLGCLLVTFVKSGCATKKERLQVLALSAEEVATLIEKNAIFWQGSLESLRIPHQQQLAPQKGPAIAIVLPLATDAMRVLSAPEDTSAEALVQNFVSALDEQEKHKQAQEMRLLSSEAWLRQEQDDEYAAALAVDRVKDAEAAAKAETAAAESAVRELTSEPGSQINPDGNEASAAAVQAEEISQEQQLAERRRLLAEEFLQEPETEQSARGRARLLLRLPAGERVERSFAFQDTLSKVRRWVECCALLPDAKGQDLAIPEKFELCTAFPKRKLGGDEEDQKSLEELGLAPSAVLLLVNSTA